jgi:hypothetical protein
MKITDQVCARQQAERLKALGVAQDGSYFFINPTGEVMEVWMLGGTEDDFCAAFTVSEMGQMLPNGYNAMRITRHTLHLYRWRGYDLDDKNFPGDRGYRTEAEARAAMLIHLLEIKAITTAQVNERLKG